MRLAVKSKLLLIQALVAVTLVACVESQSEETKNTAKKSESSDNQKNPAWWQSNNMAAGTANGSGSVAAPVAVSVPNYGGAPSNLSALVDAVAAQVPQQPKNSDLGVGAQSFGRGGGLLGGGLLSGFGNLLMGLLGIR